MLGFFAALCMTFVEGAFQRAAKPVGSAACLGSAEAASCQGVTSVMPQRWRREEGFIGCGKTQRRRDCSAGILPTSVELKGVAGWKPALRQLPKEFFRRG